VKSLFFAISTCFLVSALSTSAQSVPPLINYQGRLTDQSGAPLTAGLYGIQFRLWDSPLATGTNDLIWGQQYANLAVQANGVFSVILGSPGGTSIPGTVPAVNNLAYAFASSNVFLGVTVTVSNGVALTSPSEILPRQQLLSVPYAFSAVNASTALSANSATLAASVLPGSIVNASLAGGIITLTNLAPRQIGTNVSIGGIAISSKSPNGVVGLGPVPNMVVSLVTSGRPVLVFVTAADATASCQLWTDQQNLGGGNAIAFQRDGTSVGIYAWALQGNINAFSLPGSSLIFLDTPPAGSHTYSLLATQGYDFSLFNAKLVAFEL